MIDVASKSINAQKNEIRKEAKLKRAAMDEKTVQKISSAICQRVIELKEFLEADAVFCYAPIGNEICVDAISREALRLGKILAFPKCKADGVMEFFAVNTMQELKIGKFEILEPSKSCSAVKPFDFEHSICILPALTFDNGRSTPERGA